MNLKIALWITISAWLITNAISAATFTVNDDFDNSFAHDLNPGDGICEVSPGTGVCPLRAALEEANATAASDVIFFNDALAGVTVTLAASEGGLPAITSQVFILGDSIDAYNDSATLLRNAPPQFTIDGSQLSGLPSGLVFDAANASGSQVTALGIINFAGNGILLRNTADNIRIDRNYIGARPDNFAAAGNGIHGIHAFNTQGHGIGKRRNAGGTAFVGLGNVISSNGAVGVLLENSNNNSVHSNLIGFSPSGTSDRGNGQYGIRIIGNNNAIGDRINSLLARNHIGANNLGGILVTGNSNSIHANSLGRGETGGFIASEGDGIQVFGNLNFIGNNNDNGNMIFEHAGRAIRLGTFAGAAANDNFVIGNQVGSAGSQFPILLSGNGQGIEVGNGDRNVLVDNVVLNSLGNGIFVRGDENSLQRNQVGFAETIGGPADEPNQEGIRIAGQNNTIGNVGNGNLVGGNVGIGIVAEGMGNNIVGNLIGVSAAMDVVGNTGPGLALAGSQHTVMNNIIGNNSRGVFLLLLTDTELRSNHIGIAPNGMDISNAGDGIFIGEQTNAVAIISNDIAFNGFYGIRTSADASISGATWFQNRMHSNFAAGIDLNSDGATANDSGDADEGPDRLQNSPAIENVVLDRQASPATLTISYRVDSDFGNADYPLFVDFYWSDVDEDAQGRFFVASDFEYDTPNALQTVTFDFVNGVFGGWLTAIASDQGENSSEMASRFVFGDPDEVFFRDSFEN